MKLRRFLSTPLRSVYVAIATALIAAGVAPAFMGTAAASLITSRSIQMTDSTASATSVNYKVSFNTITTGNTAGFVVDFCGDSPIIAYATCSLPAGFTLTASPTVTGQTSTVGCNISTFTTVGTLNSNRTLTLTASSAVNFTVTPCAVSFTINGVTNPSTANQTFYARIYSYATAAAATGYTVASPGAYLDAGGVALSTASNISITARVQEQLSFCVFTGSCGTAPTITLGNTQGVLSATGPFVDKNTNYTIQTNASGQAAINIEGPTLTSGANTIAAITAINTASSSGTSQFGLCNYESSGGTLVPVSAYSGTNGGNHCSGTSQTAGTGSTGGDNGCYFYYGAAATSAPGDTIANDSAGSTATGVIAFIGNTSVSQTAGVYTTTLKMIATGTF